MWLVFYIVIASMIHEGIDLRFFTMSSILRCICLSSVYLGVYTYTPHLLIYLYTILTYILIHHTYLYTYTPYLLIYLYTILTYILIHHTYVYTYAPYLLIHLYTILTYILIHHTYLYTYTPYLGVSVLRSTVLSSCLARYFISFETKHYFLYEESDDFTSHKKLSS